MTEQAVEIARQKAHEAFPAATPRVISDDSSQFISKEFKHLLMQVGMTPTPSPYYPQNNRKLERCNKPIKESLRTLYIVEFEDGCRLISAFVEYSNTQRLHSASGSVTPVDNLNGREALIVRQREDKPQATRQRRQALRPATPANPLQLIDTL